MSLALSRSLARVVGAFVVVPASLLVVLLAFIASSAEATTPATVAPVVPANGFFITPTPTPCPNEVPLLVKHPGVTGDLQVTIAIIGGSDGRVVGPLGEYRPDGGGNVVVDLVPDSVNSFEATVDLGFSCFGTQTRTFTIEHDSSLPQTAPTPEACRAPGPAFLQLTAPSSTNDLQVEIEILVGEDAGPIRVVGPVGEYERQGSGSVTVELIPDATNDIEVSMTIGSISDQPECPGYAGYNVSKTVTVQHMTRPEFCPTPTPVPLVIRYESPTSELQTTIGIQFARLTRIVRSDGVSYSPYNSFPSQEQVVDLIPDSENIFDVYASVERRDGSPVGCPDALGYTLTERIVIVHQSEPIEPFACTVDAGVLRWNDAGQAKYWLYKSTDGANYAWLGKSEGGTQFYDPAPTQGATYQVHYQGIDRQSCTIVAEPGNASVFDCEADAGVLRWPDAGQDKYWVYKSTDGVNYGWLGKSLGGTSFFDPAPAVGATYEVHYAGIARQRCAVVAEPGDVDRFACQTDGGDLRWSDAGQEKYWVYKSTDGVTSMWLGRTLGETTINDPNHAAGTTYEVHYAGIGRVTCTERT